MGTLASGGRTGANLSSSAVRPAVPLADLSLPRPCSNFPARVDLGSRVAHRRSLRLPPERAMTVTAAPPARREKSVSGRLRTLAGLSLLTLALLLAAILAGAASTGAGLRTIGHDAGPQVLATTGLYRQMSEMDALVAETLLLGSEY